MDHFVVLDNLPEGLQFPPEYSDRITYDPESRRLCHRGFMCKGDFDRLWLLTVLSAILWIPIGIRIIGAGPLEWALTVS
jgi:hypothetical protein